MVTSAQLPLCVHCGTARPADQSLCPTCRAPWIDVRVGAVAGARVGAAAVGSRPSVTSSPPQTAPGVASPMVPPSFAPDEAPPPTPAPPVDEQLDPGIREERRSRRWLLPALLVVAVAVVYGLIVSGILDGGTPAAAPEDGTTTVPTTETSSAPQATSAPPTTAAATVTTTAPTTTTTTLPQASSLSPFGDPVPPGSLQLKAAGIGPIAVGAPAFEALGGLVASLGTPDEIVPAGESVGLCPGEEGLIVRWAELNAITVGDVTTGTFVGYRYEEPRTPTSHIDLTTLSGLHLGDSVADLESTYSSYAVTYEVIDGNDHFRLRDQDELLLWGPVTSTEPGGRVVGIFSPMPCPRG